MVSTLILALAVAVTVSAAPADVAVTFRLHAPVLSETNTVYITGSLPGLGMWDPGSIPMEYVGDHVWTHQAQAQAGMPIEYKYTLGSWAREGANANGRPLPNFVIRPTEDAEVTDSILLWTTGEPSPVEGGVTGEVRYHRGMAGEGVRPRDVVVWLPPGYDDSDDHYPVLYMHDGQNVVDPRTSAFGVDWQIDETCTELIESGAIAPLLVVGVHNTPDRTREYLPGEKGDAYRGFVTGVLKPLIDDTYRTRPGRESTFIGGSSAGGLCAFILAWENPDVFSKAMCMSPAFRFGNPGSGMSTDYVATVEGTDAPDPRPFLYIDNGGVGLERSLQPGIDAMLEVLEAKGLVPGRDFVWVHAPGAEHNEAAWANRFPEAIRTLMRSSAGEAAPSGQAPGAGR